MKTILYTCAMAVLDVCSNVAFLLLLFGLVCFSWRVVSIVCMDSFLVLAS